MVVAMAQLLLIGRGVSQWEGDKIGGLPGQPPVSFNHYSGYVNVSLEVDHQYNPTSTSNKHKSRDKALFYYFVEAQSDPFSQPLVLWLISGVLLK